MLFVKGQGYLPKDKEEKDNNRKKHQKRKDKISPER
jgi:hypothetical protein